MHALFLLRAVGVDKMVDKNCGRYLYLKRGVYYFSRHVPIDVRQHHAVARVLDGPMVLMLYLGMVATAGPFFLLNFALRHLSVGRMALFSSLVGPLSVPMAALFLGETIQGLEIAAIATVMLGVFLPNIIGPRLLAGFRR